MRLIQKILLLMFMLIPLFAHATFVDLGSLSISNVTATSSSRGANGLNEVRNGYIPTWNALPIEGWSTGRNPSSQESIEWDFHNSPSAELSSDQSLEYYLYTIHFHFGYRNTWSLKSYTLAYADDSEQYTDILNFDSLSTTGGNIISADNTGTISTTQPEDSTGILSVHTLTFKTSSVVNSIKLTTGLSDHGWNPFNEFIMSEATFSASAEVIPEPSTYALISGILAFIGIYFQRKKQSESLPK